MSLLTWNMPETEEISRKIRYAAIIRP